MPSGRGRSSACSLNRIVLANEFAAAEGADGASGLDTASRLHEIATPTVVACGELDISIKVQSSTELAQALANATYRSLPGRAHLPYLEDPDEIAALILAA